MVICVHCGDQIDWLSDFKTVDAWVKDGYQFYGIECDCGEQETVSFVDTKEFTGND